MVFGVKFNRSRYLLVFLIGLIANILLSFNSEATDCGFNEHYENPIIDVFFGQDTIIKTVSNISVVTHNYNSNYECPTVFDFNYVPTA